MRGWEFVGSSLDGDSFVIDGVDVWKSKWLPVEGPKAEVKDPHYGRDFLFAVYEVRGEGFRVRFAAGEFSNCVWGFYVPAAGGAGADDESGRA